MRNRARYLPAALLLAAPLLAAGQALPSGRWVLLHGEAAPWVSSCAAERSPPTALLGRKVVFEARRIRSDSPLACDKLSRTATALPPQGLFQGNLPAPAEEAARRLGFERFPVRGMRADCDNGSFDYHFVEPGTLRVALDNVVWTLVREDGDGTPRTALMNFYGFHLANDMGFTQAGAAARTRWLSPGLRQLLEDYFAAPGNPDEAPPIDGDPFTDTQEYPTGFRIVALRQSGESAEAAMTFDLGGKARRSLQVVLRGCPQMRWCVDDLRYEDGDTLRGILGRALQDVRQGGKAAENRCR